MNFIKKNKNSFLSFSTFIVFTNIFGGFFAYLYQLAMGKYLEPQSYASLVALLGTTMIFSAPFKAINMHIVRIITNMKSILEQKKFVSIIYSRCIFLSFILFLIIIFFFNNILSFYKISEYKFSILIFFIFLIFSLLTNVNLSILQGKKFFYKLGFYNSLGHIYKFLFGIILVLIGLSFYGALFGLLISAIIIFGLSLKDLQFKFEKKYFLFNPINIFSKKISLLLFANLMFYVMLNFDVIFINYFFSTTVSSNFAISAVLAKIVFYIPGGIITVLFTLVSDKKNKKTFYLLIQSTLYTILACTFIIFIFYLFGKDLIYILFGNKYILAHEFLFKYSLAIFPMTLVFIFENYLIAKGKFFFTWAFLLVVPIELFALFKNVGDIDGIISVILVSNYCFIAISCSLLLIQFFFDLYKKNNKKRNV